MNEYFYKLDFKLNATLSDELEKIAYEYITEENEYHPNDRYNESAELELPKFFFYPIENTLKEKCYNLLPSKLLEKEKPDAVITNMISSDVTDFETYNQLPLHTDLPARKTVINCYIKTNGEMTNFYRSKENISPTIFRFDEDVPNSSYNASSPGKIYLDVDEFDVKASFTAMDTECYMLNVAKIHGVSYLNSDCNRLSLSFAFQNRFDVLNQLV